MQNGILTALLSRNRMGRMLWMEQNNEAGKKAYTLNEMLQDLNKAIFTEVYAGKSVDVYRRGLQKAYVGRLLQQVFTQINDGDISTMVVPFGYNYVNSDAYALLRDNLNQILALVKQAKAGAVDKYTRLHLQDLENRITAKFNAEKKE